MHFHFVSYGQFSITDSTARSVGPKYITVHAKNPYLSDTDMYLCIVGIGLCPFSARIILKM